ncbi:MAG TPA: YetF domain-containing protein [Edaphobacter sp.]|nr:YetF domain-containing protein [Edaphobacter sp.]
MIESMFHLHLPLLEKILRPVIVYLCLIVFLRIFGKRELAQLNPFDLVVLLCLSNTVQNSIIGDDNSVSGGIVGVLSLLTINWLLTRALFNMPKLNEALEGEETVLIRHGVVDWEAAKKEALTELELKTVIHKQGLSDFSQVEKCVLEPSGNFYVEQKDPMRPYTERAEVLKEIKELAAEVKELKLLLGTRG